MNSIGKSEAGYFGKVEAVEFGTCGEGDFYLLDHDIVAENHAEPTSTGSRVFVSPLDGAMRLAGCKDRELRHLSAAVLLIGSMKYAILIIAATLLGVTNSRWTERLAFWSRAELNAMQLRLEVIETELAALPVPRMAHTSSRSGFQTSRVDESEPLWVEVTLERESLIDSMALIPVLQKGDESRGSCFGFPVRHRVEAFMESGDKIVLFESTADLPNPNGYPWLHHFEPVKARRVRVTVTKPWEGTGGQEIFAISEMMIFSGNGNVALSAPVSASSSRYKPPAWSASNLTDHITPLGLPVKHGEPTLQGYHSGISKAVSDPKSLVVTFPSLFHLDEITLVPMPRRDVPTWVSYGFPTRYRVEVSKSGDFDDAYLVQEYAERTMVSPGENLVSFPLHRRPVRSIRLTTIQLWERTADYLLALSEVMAFDGEKNVALHADVHASDSLEDPAYSAAALTDGQANVGPLLDLPDWLSRLEKRKQFEQEHSTLTITRTALLARSQEQLLRGTIGSSVVLSLLAATALIRQSHNRRRDAERLRERLARDLHDEIGSNLGSIALISAFASQEDSSPESVRKDLAEVQRIARESAESMREMVRLISPRGERQDDDWLAVLRTLAQRLLRGITSDIQLTASVPDLEARRELYLFIKEVLHNIATHARAKNVRFHITQSNNRLHVEIGDDGIGFDPSFAHTGHGLSNLRERAATMGGLLHIQSQPGHGTRITLSLPL
jgi:signal transduction histidine kinase